MNGHVGLPLDLEIGPKPDLVLRDYSAPLLLPASVYCCSGRRCREGWKEVKRGGGRSVAESGRIWRMKILCAF